jgi:hypothetical protein
MKKNRTIFFTVIISMAFTLVAACSDEQQTVAKNEPGDDAARTSSAEVTKDSGTTTLVETSPEIDPVSITGLYIKKKNSKSTLQLNKDGTYILTDKRGNSNRAKPFVGKYFMTDNNITFLSGARQLFQVEFKDGEVLDESGNRWTKQ